MVDNTVREVKPGTTVLETIVDNTVREVSSGTIEMTTREG